MPDDLGRDRDLVLPPNTYAFVLDNTKGKVNVFVGPYKNSLSQTDRLVRWDAATQRFVEIRDMDQAITVFSVAGEGQYTVLSNPAHENIHPPKGNSTESVELEVGRQVNVPGPATFALWPGQVAKTIDGHHLRHNQYLIVRVYDSEQAAANWESAVVAPQGDGEGDSPVIAPSTGFTMGQLIVVKGTDVSFYIPPTGIEVVAEGGNFVREAVTLERLEYCILLDENGEKRYVQGPDVVFPKPTEKFVLSETGSRKFVAIELNEHSGLFIKVIAPYEDADGTEHTAGEELFITGKDTPIYFPRPEHSIVQYGDRKVHFAIAIPAGEGRYVLNRDTGEVDLVTGPKMFLPDPRNQVIVLRILSDTMIDLLYPGNGEAHEVNESYRQMSNRVKPEERLTRGISAQNVMSSTIATAAAAAPMSGEFAGDTFKRGTTYSQPRSIVLDTKYDGAIAVNIWPGYAILVTNKTGDRRVEIGPKAVLLEYDEIIMPLSLSTGKPKNTDRLMRTAYLRITNNQIGDIITVETRDLVAVRLKLSYRVNFEGDDPLKWFDTENYVKILTDHARSRLRSVAKHYGIQEFYTQTIEIIRDALLGESTDTGPRPGLAFEENGMRVYDVEVLEVAIQNESVAGLLVKAQNDALSGAIELSTAEERTERTRRLEELKQEVADYMEATRVKNAEVAFAELGRVREQRKIEIGTDLVISKERAKVVEETLSITKREAETTVDIARLRDSQRVEVLVQETNEYIRKLEAVSPEFVAALQQFGDKNFVENLVKAVGPAAVAAGVTSADIFKQIFAGTPFEGALNALADRPLALNSRPPRDAALI